jgi:hypothetical protein
MTIKSRCCKKKLRQLKCNLKKQDVKEIRLGNSNLKKKCETCLSSISPINREMLDGAQRMISELKSDPSKKTKSGSDAARSREVRLMN